MATLADHGATPSPPPPPERIVVVRRRSPWVPIVRVLAIILGALVTIAAAFLLWLNSDAGRRFLVNQINGLEMASGLRIHVDEIEGSIWDKMTVKGLTLSDSKGVFFAAPTAQVEYTLTSYLRNSQLDIQSLTIPEARLGRLPELRTVDPNAPFIPNITLDIGALRVDRLRIDPAVTGKNHLLSIAGELHLANSQARTALQVAALQGPGIAGGDRFNLRLDAAPEDNVLNINARLRAPGDGFFAGLAGIADPVDAVIAGQGSWANWRGRAQAQLKGQPFADLNIQAQNGTFTIMGPTRPDLFVTGPAQRLTAPLTQLNLVARWENRRADINLRLNSRSAAIAAEGLIDLGQNRYEGLRIAARLIQPGAIAPNLRVGSPGTELEFAL